MTLAPYPLRSVWPRRPLHTRRLAPTKPLRDTRPGDAPAWWRDRFDAQAGACHLTQTFMEG